MWWLLWLSLLRRPLLPLLLDGGEELFPELFCGFRVPLDKRIRGRKDIRQYSRATVGTFQVTRDAPNHRELISNASHRMSYRLCEPLRIVTVGSVGDIRKFTYV